MQTTKTKTTPKLTETLLKEHSLVYVPHPSLLKQVDPFDFDELDYKTTLRDHMFTLMQNHRGIGLSANQINLNASVFAMEIDGEKTLMINPTVHNISNDKILMSEGCLSEPGLYLKVKRPASVQASWETVDGERKAFDLHGLNARVFLHEYDHLQGIMFTDRVGKVKLMAARKKQLKVLRSFKG